MLKEVIEKREITYKNMNDNYTGRLLSNSNSGFQKVVECHPSCAEGKETRNQCPAKLSF